MERVLIIEDEKSIREILKIAFLREGFEVSVAEDLKKGLQLFEEFKPVIVILDLMLPDGSGFSICEKIKDSAYVIMVTALSQIDIKLKGIELGADDYITKPFHIKEVVLRAKGILRRKNKSIFEEGIFINEAERIAKKDGRVLKLNKKEFELLNLFYKNKNIVFSREKLLELIWGYDYEGEDRTVDVHIRRLRGKLGEMKEGSSIETIFGVGYVMR
ncbi:MAG: response regulator transcription factor [Clostridium sp.]|uniref:response regulator transcription factor n=1 Tax=Clostridium sp. TaxID=1506 RepID=UPI003F376728